MSPAWTHRPSILLVAALETRRDVAMSDELPMSWHVDAMVVALARAAMAQGVGLVVPAEPRFAPLVADIVAEYAAPREAEGLSGQPQGSEAEDLHSMLRFVTFGAPRGATVTSALLSSLRPFQELGMVDSAVDQIAVAADKYKLRAAVLVGSGRLVTQAMRSDTVLGLPRHRFLAPTSKRRGQQQDQAMGIAGGMDGEFTHAKDRIKHYRPRVGDAPLREQDAVAPIDFWRYPAYPMYANQVIWRVLDEGSPRAR